MRRRVLWTALVVPLACVMAIVVIGLTDSFGTGAVMTRQIGGSTSDGADRSTFWDSAVIDVPGISVTAVHCHGSVTYSLELGATGPARSNPCYAAMGAYSGGSSALDLFATLPGDMALYRTSEDYGPWRYCIRDLITAPPDQAPATAVLSAVAC